MADRYGTNSSYSSNASPSLPLESEDMSSFLHHLLHNNNPSSSSSSCMPIKTRHFTTMTTTTMTSPVMLSSVPGSNNSPIGLFHEKVFHDAPRRSDHFDVCFESDYRAREGKLGVADPSSSSFNFSDPGGYFGADARSGGGRENLFSRAAAAVDTEAITISDMRINFQTENDSDSYGYDSEKGLEVAELLTNPVPPRSSSKRSRAAEIHNLSEKRRRSRINEKIKALQKLIPNSNKTDKASMLDEAIEYLKQLQLQVQMLSMRNGLSLHPLYMPGAGQPMQLMQTLDEGNGILNTNAGRGPITANQEPSNQTAYDFSNLCTSSNQPITAPSFGFEPATEARYRPFNLPSVSKGFGRGGDALPELQLDVNHSGKNNSSSGVS